MFWIHAPREHRKLERLYDEAADLVYESGVRLFGRAPAVSGWTPAQHLHHLAQINGSLFDWLTAQCDGAAPMAAQGRPNVLGYVLLFVGRLPRGRAQSPRRFVPPGAVARAALVTLVRRGRDALRALADCAPRMKRLEGRQKHPHMGFLSAPQWMRFAWMHTRHHVHIVRDILAALEGDD